MPLYDFRKHVGLTLIGRGKSPFHPRSSRDRAEGGSGGALAPPLICKNKNKFNKK